MNYNAFNRQYGKTSFMIKQAVKSAIENPLTEIRIFGHISVRRKLEQFLIKMDERYTSLNITFIERAVLSREDIENFNINFNNDFIDHHLLESTLENRDWLIDSLIESNKKLKAEIKQWKTIAKSFKDLIIKTDKMLD